jgi:hypothetical protein
MTEPLNTIERILSSEPPVEPSAHFTLSVMEAVRTESSNSALTFPWKRFALGCVGAALLGAFASLAVFWKPFGDGAGMALPVLVVSLALLVSFASVRLSEALVTSDFD